MGETVVVKTERGEVVGRFVASKAFDSFSLIYVPSSASFVEAPVDWVRPASQEEFFQMEEATKMAGVVRRVEQELIEEHADRHQLSLVNNLLGQVPEGFRVDEVGGFYKVEGPSRRVAYLSRNARRLDVSGFSFDHPLMCLLSEEEARTRKLGRVRGQALDVSPEEIQDLWHKCLEAMKA